MALMMAETQPLPLINPHVFLPNCVLVWDLLRAEEFEWTILGWWSQHLTHATWPAFTWPVTHHYRSSRSKKSATHPGVLTPATSMITDGVLCKQGGWHQWRVKQWKTMAYMRCSASYLMDRCIWVCEIGTQLGIVTVELHHLCTMNPMVRHKKSETMA